LCQAIQPEVNRPLLELLLLIGPRILGPVVD
jgi:hypothetical protein